MKKIVLTSNVIWSIVQFRKELLIELKKEYEVICIADIDSFSDNSLLTLKNIGIEFIEIPIDRKGINPIKDLEYMSKLLRIYKEIKPDFVLHYSIKPNIYGSLVCKILKIKNFSVITGLGSSFIKDGFITKFIRFMYKSSLKYCDKVLFLNSDDEKVFLDNNIIDKLKSIVLPGEGVNLEHYQCCTKKINKDKLSFILIARLIKDKGIYEYIEAAKEFKGDDNLEFLLAGPLDPDNPTGICLKEIEQWSKIKIVKYLGKTDNINDFFNQSDVVILPSYREGLSRILLEACSSHKPIIASNIAGCRELCVDGETGFLCDVKNSKSLILAIKKIIALDSNQRKDMGYAGRKLIKEKYSSEIVNSILIQNIKNILGDK